MTTLYKKGSQHHIRFDGVDYDVDIVKSKDDAELSKFKKAGWFETLPETVETKPNPKKKAKE